MADDTGAHSAVPDIKVSPSEHQRGPLRPERLQSVRTRVSGAGLARLFQFGDGMALLFASLVAHQAFAMPQVMAFGAP